jgi:hypothetical protein
MNTRKVRRRLVEDRVRDFRDVGEFLIDHPLLLWSPRLDEITKSMVKAFTKIKERKQSCRKEPQEREHQG